MNLDGISYILISFFILAAILFATYQIIHKKELSKNTKIYIYFSIVFIGFFIIFIVLPINTTTKNSFFSLFGLLISIIVAISSTTFVSNAMAGAMLRRIKNFKPGDFIQVDEHFGRISETGLLHTEIQTRNSNLTTLPNIFLVTHPVTVMPEKEVLVDATLSLGYDVSHHKVEKVLKEAAEKVNLIDSFVQITDLGDFSISYRVAGFLEDGKKLLGVRSNLRKQIIDSLHTVNIEIVSPEFINLRQFKNNETFLSKSRLYQQENNAKTEETKVFDKAEAAEKINSIETEIKNIEELIKQEKTKDNSDEKILSLKSKKERLEKQIKIVQESITHNK